MEDAKKDGAENGAEEKKAITPEQIEEVLDLAIKYGPAVIAEIQELWGMFQAAKNGTPANPERLAEIKAKVEAAKA